MLPFLENGLTPRMIKFIAKLGLVWSALLILLIFAIHFFQFSTGLAYLLAAIPCLLLWAIAILITRLKKLDAAMSRDSTLYGIHFFVAIFFVAILLAISLLSVQLEVSFFREYLFPTALVAGIPFLLGALFTTILFVRPPAPLTPDTPIPPVRMKLAKPGLRRIFRMVALYMVYATVQFISFMLFDCYALSGTLAFAVALLPVLPLFGLIPIYNKYMEEEQDEFQRHLFHQSILWAFFGAIVISSALGRLEDYSLIFHRHPGYFHPYMIFPVFWFLQNGMVGAVNAVHTRRISIQEKQNP